MVSRHGQVETWPTVARRRLDAISLQTFYMFEIFATSEKRASDKDALTCQIR